MKGVLCERGQPCTGSSYSHDWRWLQPMELYSGINVVLIVIMCSRNVRSARSKTENYDEGDHRRPGQQSGQPAITGGLLRSHGT